MHVLPPEETKTLLLKKDIETICKLGLVADQTRGDIIKSNHQYGDQGSRMNQTAYAYI